MRSPKPARQFKQRRGRPGPSRAAIRRIFTENFGLKLFSLGMAILMWAFVASQRRGESTEIKFTTPLVFKNIPSSLEVVSAPINSVGLLVSVQRSLGHSVNPNLFQIAVDLTQHGPGQIKINLSEKNVSYNNEPPPVGMKILQISPSVIPMGLEEALEKEVAIKPRFFGDLAEGFTIETIRIKPEKAVLQGARSRLDKLDFIFTQPLDVQDLRSDVEMLVDLALTQEVRLSPKQEAFFQAFITVAENASQLLLRDIPVVFQNVHHTYKASTKTVNVYMEGPDRIIRDLKREDIFAVFDMTQYPPGDYRSQSPTIVVPESVKVLEQWPIIDLFIIQRTGRKTG